MTNRSANATITGYHYQFDKTILEILHLPHNSDLITMEGIEDIDVQTMIKTTAIQCKYYAAQKYSSSVIRNAVIAMLNDFLDRLRKERPLIKYIIYGYYKESSDLKSQFGLDEIKELLQWNERNPTKHRNYQTENKIKEEELVPHII